MGFVKKLFTYWFILLVIGFGTYFCVHNLDPIRVDIPQVGVFRVTGAVVFVSTFLFGCSVSSIYFGMDYLKKNLEIRRLKKRMHRVGAGGKSPGADSVGQPRVDTLSDSYLEPVVESKKL